MSLFKVRDWWSTKCGLDEEFDKGCLCVGNIDNDTENPENAKIVTGSFSGMLRIYNPRQAGFRPDDLLLEQQLGAPIIQVEMGRFIPNMRQLALAVLHPRKLVVYNVSRVGGNAQNPGYYVLEKQYEHALTRVAYNFVYGPFGGVYGKDYICVQSLDGQLSFFEQDSFVFSRFLQNFLIPGPLCYSSTIDCFLTYNSRMEVECYKYQMLAASSGSDEKEDKGAMGGKRIQVDWSVNIGEHVVDIIIAKYSRTLSTSQSDIVVVGERTLFTLTETGSISSQKRLDYFPSAITSYSVSPDATSQNLIIGTHNSSLMIYKDPLLIWSAGTPHVPVVIKVATIGGLRGTIVTMDDTGDLHASYLGTDPASNPIPTIESKEIDYEEMDEEHKRLQALIRHAVSSGKQEPKDNIVLRAQVPTSLDQDNHGNKERSVTVRLFVSYTGDDNLENVSLSVIVSHPITVTQPTIVLPQISGGARSTPVILPIKFIGGKECIPTSLMAEVIAVYTSPAGEPHTAKCNFILPLCLAGSTVPPVKHAQYKITLATTRVPPQLQLLFEDVLGADSSNGSQTTLTFQYTNGEDATILVSKNASRYRIQSSSFHALWLLTSELVRRLQLFYLTNKDEQSNEPFMIQYPDSLPFMEYFQTIDEHFDARLELKKSQDALSNMAHQFRSIQKRLLIRFKDRNPAPLNQLDVLFESTYSRLVDLAGEVEAAQEKLKRASNHLSCATSLMLLLIRYNLNMLDEDYNVLEQFLSPIVLDSAEQGWEECTDASMTHLLRTSLAKNAKESASVPAPLVVPKDTQKLKKHIALVVDRIAKGGKLYRKDPSSGNGAGGKKKKGSDKKQRPQQQHPGDE